VITGRTAGDQASRLANCPRHTDLTLGLFVWPARFELAHQRIRDAGLAEAAEVRACLRERTGMMPGKIGTDTPAARGPRDKTEVVLVIEEELSGHEIRARRDLAGEETDVGQVIDGVRMALGKAGDADGETVRLLRGDLPDEPLRMREALRMRDEILPAPWADRLAGRGCPRTQPCHID
jgi:hypothetical protein